MVDEPHPLELHPPTARVFRTILVVEDECLIALDIQMILENAGYDVLGPAASIEEACVLLDEDPPDAAILDINLRGESVLPIVHRLYRRDIPFVVASAYRSLEFIGSRIVLAAENVGKPISETHLLAAVDRAVRSSPSP